MAFSEAGLTAVMRSMSRASQTPCHSSMRCPGHTIARHEARQDPYSVSHSRCGAIDTAQHRHIACLGKTLRGGETRAQEWHPFLYRRRHREVKAAEESVESRAFDRTRCSNDEGGSGNDARPVREAYNFTACGATAGIHSGSRGPLRLRPGRPRTRPAGILDVAAGPDSRCRPSAVATHRGAVAPAAYENLAGTPHVSASRQSARRHHPDLFPGAPCREHPRGYTER